MTKHLPPWHHQGVECDRPRVLIAGAGLGGIMTAILLGRAGIPYDIFERAREIKPIGTKTTTLSLLTSFCCSSMCIFTLAPNPVLRPVWQQTKLTLCFLQYSTVLSNQDQLWPSMPISCRSLNSSAYWRMFKRSRSPVGA